MSTEPLLVDREQAIAMLKQVAEGKEGYVYEYIDPKSGMTKCSYVHADDQPGCIVGQALHQWGVSVERLKALDKGVGERLTTSSFGEPQVRALVDDLVKFTPGAVKVLRGAQFQQDAGLPWGEAVEAAEEAPNGD